MTVAERLDRVREQPFRFTAEEFMALAQHPPLSEWPGKIELVDGRIVRVSPANTAHWLLQQQLTRDLQAVYDRAHADWIVGSEATVRLDRRRVRIPDIAVLTVIERTIPILQASWLFLAVEISDTTLRIDLGPKKRDYARAGVPHYWVVDVKNSQTHVMAEPVDGAYTRVNAIPFGGPISVPGTSATIVIA